METMRLVAAFISGVAVASIVAVILASNNRQSSIPDGVYELPANPNENRLQSETLTAIKRSVVKSGRSSGGGIAKPKLKVALWDLTARGNLREFLDGISDSDAAILDERLSAFHHRIRQHEQREIRFVSREENVVSMFIPAYSEDGSELARFREDLTSELGQELVDSFMEVASETLWYRIAQWGKAEQSITVDLGQSPPHIEHKFEERDAQGFSLRMSTFGEQYSPKNSDLSWVNPFLNEENDQAIRAEQDADGQAAAAVE